MKIVEGISLIVSVYLAVFVFWVMLAGTCVTSISEGASCGNDVMTRFINVTHRPIINLIK